MWRFILISTLAFSAVALGAAENVSKVNGSIRIEAERTVGDLSTVNGSIEVGEGTRAADLETVNGSIDTTGLSSNAKLETVNGSVKARFASMSTDQAVEIASVNGRSEIVLPDDADCGISARTVNGGIRLTQSIEVLKEISRGGGPRKCLLALSYAGWGPGQLEREIKQNGWLNVAADEELIFGPAIDEKWRRALAKMGIDPTMLSSSAGRA